MGATMNIKTLLFYMTSILLVSTVAGSSLISTFPEITGTDDFTHTVLVEYGATTSCGPCVNASRQLSDLYNSGEYDFYYVSLVKDKNDAANLRCLELGIIGIPDVYFDGPYTHVVGYKPSDQRYRDALNSSGTRTVADLDLNGTVMWEDPSILDINLTIQNNAQEEYNGMLRIYIVEKISRWLNDAIEPFRYAVLDIVKETIVLTSTIKVNLLWNGADHGFEDIYRDNIILIAAIFDGDTGFVDEVFGATPVSSTLEANAHGPYAGVVDQPIQFTGSVSGGVPSYIWEWDLGDGNTSQLQNPTYTYTTAGNYTVTLTVTDSLQNSDTDNTTATITIENDTIPPTVLITQPENAIYFNNKKLCDFRTPVIIKSIDITVEATDDNSGVYQVEFYIDNELQSRDTSEPYEWTWDEPAFFRHTIMVKAFDHFENSANDNITVWKFF
jgi:hypothetical protein